jgi:hypothetical protein
LEGTIVFSSANENVVLIDTGIFRSGKGGSFIKVNGELHKNDVSKDLLHSLKKKGRKMPVYVKEVFKNSGLNFHFN